MLSILKKFVEVPFAHRQHQHTGHCSAIHGHNWTIDFELTSDERDVCGFIFDFGEMDFVKKKLAEFDHACVLSSMDPLVSDENFLAMVKGGVFRLIVLPDVSCEGLAEHFYHWARREFTARTEGNVTVQSVTVHEDSKNSATRSY